MGYQRVHHRALLDELLVVFAANEVAMVRGERRGADFGLGGAGRWFDGADLGRGIGLGLDCGLAHGLALFARFLLGELAHRSVEVLALPIDVIAGYAQLLQAPLPVGHVVGAQLDAAAFAHDRAVAA